MLLLRERPESKSKLLGRSGDEDKRRTTQDKRRTESKSKLLGRSGARATKTA